MTRVALLPLLAILLSSNASAADGLTRQLDEIRFDASQVQFVERDQGVAVRYPGALPQTEAGAADLPVSLVWVEIPDGTRMVGVEVDRVETRSLGEMQLAAAPGPRHPDDAEVPVALHAGIRRSDTLVPATWATPGLSGSMRGRRLAAVHVHPLRWNPATGELVLATRLVLRVTVEPTENGQTLPRHRIVPSIERRFDQSLRAQLPDLQPLSARGAPLVGEGPAGPGPYQPTFRPTTDGSPVEYVIVTNQAMEAEFDRLAAWKTRKGVQAAVRTIEWIDTTYPNGVDRAERIRFFIRDAYQNWGTLFVLLGGDSDVIPIRYVTTTEPEDEAIPSDMYYGCLEGNWNGDGDDLFGEGEHDGEPGDDADILFEVSVGRATVSTIEDAGIYIDKLLLYELDAPTDSAYPASLLALAERLFSQTHGADQAENAVAMMPPWFKIVRLYEESASYPGSLELTAEVALDSLNNGFGMVLHVGHGYRNTMSVGDGTIGNSDVDNLDNAPRTSVVFAINCSSASIDYNSIGERWIKNPNGGSVIYIGTSRLSYVIPSQVYQDKWFRLMFEDSVTTIGLATDMARAQIASYFDGSFRWNMTATLLIGDPELDVYTNEIPPLAVSHPGSIELGQEQVTVSVTGAGQPEPDATVTLVKQGEVYARGVTNDFGGVQLDFAPLTTGTATLTVHKTYHRVYESDVTITATSAPYPHILSMAIDDDTSGLSSGDDDGLADAGETLEITLTLRNAGGATLTGLTGTLTVDDPEIAITLVNDTVVYGTLGAGGSSSGLGPYVLTIDADAPVAYQPLLQLALSANQGSWSDVTVLPIRRPYLEQHAHDVDDALPRGNGNGIIESGEEIWYTIDLRNSGQHQVAGVQATLRALRVSDQQPHPLVTVLDDHSTYGTILEGETATGDRFEFRLDGSVDPANVLLEITFASPPFADVVQFLDLIRPGTPDSLRAFGSPSSITLKWNPPADEDVLGYDIYRADNPFGPYHRINSYIAEGSASYENLGLPGLQRFYYQVVCRDSSYNESPASAIFSASTNPPVARGWPVEVQQLSSSSPTMVDLDGDYFMEILVGADMQYAWHYNASEVVDGDHDDRTNGPFSLAGRETTEKGFQATQAIGDLEGDGDMEVANIGWTQDSLFVWSDRGEILPGFPKTILDDFNFASPVMADLDVDGDLELIAWAAKGGRLFAWHHDGTEVVDGDNNPSTDGIMTPRIYGISFSYSSPAVCNLDADPELEVLIAVNISNDNSGGVYAINIDGSYVPGWPVFTGDPGHDSQVTASPVVADLDQDGDMEVIVVAERDGGSIFVYHHDGSIATGWPVQVPSVSPVTRVPSPALGDLDSDTYLDIVYAGTDGQLYALDRFGSLLNGFPVTYNDLATQNSESTPALVNVDSDPRLEILFGDERGRLHGFNHDGTEVNGFPIQTRGEIRGTPAVWDCDTDNLIEIAAMSNDGFVYLWDMPFEFNPNELAWPSFRHDTRNTGCFATPILPVGIAEPEETPGAGPARAALHDAVPNPFNPRTTIGFDVPGEAGGARRVELAIFDVQGRLVRALVDGAVESGQHAVVWDGRTDGGGGAASGVYFARLRVDGFAESRKLVMLR